MVIHRENLNKEEIEIKKKRVVRKKKVILRSKIEACPEPSRGNQRSSIDDEIDRSKQVEEKSLVEIEEPNRLMNEDVSSLKQESITKVRRVGLRLKILLIIFLIISIFSVGYFKFFLSSKIQKQESILTKQAIIIETDFVLPNTVNVQNDEGRIINSGEVNLLLSTLSSDVILPQAKYTIKLAYTNSLASAEEWSPNFKLIFIKSLGALSPSGEAEGWQIVFGSAEKKIGYEVIVMADKVASKKEIMVDSVGNQTPDNWYDTDEALSVLRGIIKNNEVGVSSVSFFYNQDSKMWQYAFATSAGVTSLNVK